MEVLKIITMSTTRPAILVVMLLVTSFAWSAPGDVLYENYFNNNGNLNSDWDRSSNSAVGVSNDTFSSASNAAYMRSGPQSLTLKNSRAISAAVPGAQLSVWVRRGSDSFSEDPDTGENLLIEYFNDSGNWITLETFSGDGTPGEIFTRVYDLPADALHGSLLIRFITTNADLFSDYWHFDDVVVTEVAPPVNLIGHWQFDEFSWDGTSNEVRDSSGNDFHGTAVGGATTLDTDPALAGNPGTCRYGSFDGADDHIAITNLSNTLNATASLAFWIKTSQSGNNTGWLAPGVAGVEQAGGADDIFWGWLDGSGRIGISVGNDYTTKSTTAINNNVWHHIVLTRDHVAGTYKIYIDGSLNASGAIAAGIIGNSYSSIGRIEDTGGSPEYFQGELDEVKVYSGVLSDADVTTIFAETHPCAATLCPGETAQSGLIGDYFNSTNLSGGIINSRVDAPINFDWGSGAPGVSGIGANNFSVQWNGFVRVTESGQYNFRTLSDDGVRLYVDNNLIINNWTDHAVQTNTSAPVSLTAGQIYPVRLEFYENGGLAEIRLQWQTPSSGSYTPIPAGPTTLGDGLYSCVNNSVAYYEISHSGSGVTCEAEPITVTAFDSLGNAMSPATGTTILLSTTPATGNWAGGNSFTFDGSSSSAVKLLQQTTPATLNIDVSDGSASENLTADPDISFSDVAVRFYGDTSFSSLPNQTAGVGDASMVLRVVETNTDTGQCDARFQNASRNIDLGYECRNPASCSSGQTLSLNGSNIQSNNNGAAINYTAVNINFDANGFGAIPFQYSDVGLIRIHSEIDLPAEGSDPAITINGSSSEFVVRPDRLVVINVQDTSGGSNPGSTNTGSGFVAAGESFEVRIEGQNAQGNRTPAFGRETTPESVQVAVNNIVFPVSGNSGVLSNPASFTPDATTPGVYENLSLNWNEVGSMTLLPSLSDGDYLGAGLVSGVESATIGRFYPAEFLLQSSSLQNACSSGAFTYLSEDNIAMQYQVAALNVSGSVVTNYDNTDLAYPAATINYAVENNNNGTNLASRFAAALSSWDDGVFILSDTSAVLNRLVDGGGNTVPESPLNLVEVGLQLTDIDSVALRNLDMRADTTGDCSSASNCTAKKLSGSINALFGRLNANSVHGPESADIPMIWQTEYWNGSRFLLNNNDSCTLLPLSNVNFGGASSVVNAAADTITVTNGGISSVFNFSDPAGISDCLTTTDIGFCGGKAGTVYGAAGAVVGYPISIDLSAQSHLQSDWNQDGSYDDTALPQFFVRFEHYRGHDRIIYWQEVLQ